MTTNLTASPPPDGPSGLPLLGSVLDFLGAPLEFSARVKNEYGPIAALNLGGRKLILIQSPDGARRILWENGNNYPKPKLGMQTLSPLLGDGIATLTDWDAWKEARTFILPLFSARMLKAYFEEAVLSVRDEVDALASYAANDTPIDVYQAMHEATFRVLVRTVFRSGIGPEEVSRLTHLFNDVTAYINVRFLTLGLPVDWAVGSARRGKRALKTLDARVYELINARRQSRAADAHAAEQDMLDVLLAARHSDGSALSDKEIRDNCMTMLFGGHETTAGSVTWAWGLLATHPDKRAKMLAEIDAALEGRAPTGFDDLRKLPYVSMVFEEAMRLYPMFPMLLREASEDDVVEGKQIRRGDLVGFSAHTIHHDPTVWENPEAFEPERHSEESKARRHKASYLPFSLGQRGCIGERMARMEGVLLLTLISQRYLLELTDDLPPVKVSMSLKPQGGLWAKVRARSTPVIP